MFRDLKEYQEIAKIYAEKVSKPENLDERVRGGGMSGPIKPFEKPAGSAAGSGNVRGGSFRPNPINKPINSGGSQGRTRPQPKPKPETDSTGKVIPSTAEIRAAAAAKRGGDAAVGGGNAGASTDSGGTSKSTIKSVPVEKEKPEVSTMTKQGKPRTKAQMMAAKRIAAGKTISDVKAENQAAMKARAKAKFEAFKKRREEKKAGMSEESEHEVNEAVGAAALKLGGMVLPKIPSALKAIGAGAATGGVLMQKIRRTKSKLNPDPDAGVDGEPEVGKVTTYKKNKRTGRYNRTTKRDKAGEESASMNKNDPAGDISNDLYKDTVRSDVGPVKKTKKGYSILKKRRERAYEKEMEKNSAQQRYNEILQGAKPIKNIGTKVIQQDHYEYDAYDLVLEYLLSTEQVATIEEANYVMTEMDANTIGSIVKEVKLSLQDK